MIDITWTVIGLFVLLMVLTIAFMLSFLLLFIRWDWPEDRAKSESMFYGYFFAAGVTLLIGRAIL